MSSDDVQRLLEQARTNADVGATARAVGATEPATPTDLVLTLEDSGDGYQVIRIGDPGDPDEHYLLFWPGSGGTANRDRWIDLVRVYGTHGALEALEDGRTNGVDPLPPLGDGTSAATPPAGPYDWAAAGTATPPAAPLPATPSTPAPTGASSGSLPGGGKTMSTVKTSAELKAERKAKVSSTESDELQAAHFRIDIRQAGGDQTEIEAIKAQIKADYPQLVSIMPDVFGVESVTWAASNGVNPSATTPAVTDDSIIRTVGKYSVRKGSGNLLEIWVEDNGVWSDSGHSFPDQAEYELELKKHDFVKAVERQLKGRGVLSWLSN
ncbi:MAG TPA: hypothetical protein VLE72_00545 [Candidatus Saccharimonadales bacterium]|nr:hypothetical protein [Candidatus Saccharimonadales bacterium]